MSNRLPLPDTPDFPERFRQLTALQQAQALLQGKRRHERKYPQAVHGGDRRSASFRDRQQSGPQREYSAPEQTGFTNFAACLLGCTARSIQISVRIAERIPAALQAALAETKVAERKRDLVRIADMSPQRHRQLLECLEAGAPSASLDALLQHRDTDRT